MIQYALVKKTCHLGGSSNDPHVRDKLTQQSQVTSLENEKQTIKIDVLRGLF